MDDIDFTKDRILQDNKDQGVVIWGERFYGNNIIVRDNIVYGASKDPLEMPEKPNSSLIEPDDDAEWYGIHYGMWGDRCHCCGKKIMPYDVWFELCEECCCKLDESDVLSVSEVQSGFILSQRIDRLFERSIGL
ncbi:MAG: hypothetical protein PQJ59_16800 [Spirochaetales bacterium]|nr:hypothetical protein [Spirochaetales bacterium]